MKERCLITGSSGFIGRHLSERLVHLGHEIKKIKHTDWNQLREEAVAFQPEWIFHLAAYGNKYNQTEAKKIYQANVFNFLDLLATTNPINYSALINFGTSSEYGRKDKPMNEEDLLEPDTLYAASKAGATLLARAWTKIYDKPIVTVRPFSVYGPEDDWGKFIMTVINCIHSRKTLTLAKGVHDWIYINDFIDGILTVVNHAHTLRGRVINIGTGVQYTNEEVVRIAEKVIGKKAKVQEANLIRSYDTTVSWVADNKLLKTLGWQPKFDLRKGIEETVKYYLPE